MSTPLEISLVTPNKDGARFLERTLTSVLGQDYPQLEYIVVDGASTDASLEIIERYRARLAHVISEPDHGHTDALNKGFASSRGEIMGWIGSDDMLLPGSLAAVNQVFQTHPEIEWITGRPTAMTEDDILHAIGDPRPWSWVRFLGGDYRHIQQESTFWRRSLWERAGGYLSMDHMLASDFELWTRFFLHAPLHSVDTLIGSFRFHGDQQSQVASERYQAECQSALRSLWDAVPADALAEYCDILAVHDSVQPSFEYAKVSPALACADAPIVRMSERSKTFVMDVGEIPRPPLVREADAALESDLTFDDGSIPLTWHEGPDFSACSFRALDVHLRSGMADSSTSSTPLVCGPVKLLDLGDGRFAVEVKVGKRIARHEFDAGSLELRLKVVASDSYMLIVRNGDVVAREPCDGEASQFEEPLVLVGGAQGGGWRGAISTLRVATVTDADMVIHELRSRSTEAASKERRPRVSASSSTPAEGLAGMAGNHAGERCFVMGNGPSLNEMDLSLLAGETVFACNAAFLLFDRVDWRPRFYTCVDARVIRDRAEDIVSMLDEHPGITSFFPSEVTLHDGSGRTFDTREIIPPGPNRHYFNEVANSMANPPHSMFSLDVSSKVIQPYTVAITMLQLTAYLGFDPIYLIGCDTSYTIPRSVKQEGRRVGDTGLLLTSTSDDDPNHFDPRYFGKGREWHNPQVEKMIEHHRWARIALQRKGVRVFNATIGGQLEVYPRVRFEDLFDPAYAR